VPARILTPPACPALILAIQLSEYILMLTRQNPEYRTSPLFSPENEHKRIINHRNNGIKILGVFLAILSQFCLFLFTGIVNIFWRTSPSSSLPSKKGHHQKYPRKMFTQGLLPNSFYERNSSEGRPLPLYRLQIHMIHGSKAMIAFSGGKLTTSTMILIPCLVNTERFHLAPFALLTGASKHHENLLPMKIAGVREVSKIGIAVLYPTSPGAEYE